MNRWITAVLILCDGVAVSAAYWITFMMRVEGGFLRSPIDLWVPMTLMTGFWWVLFVLRGLYSTPVALSRFEEAVCVFKAAVIGTVLVFIVTFDIEQPVRITRLFLLNYGVMVFIFVSAERLVIRTIQRRLRWRGIGLWNAVIVGLNDVGTRLYDQLTRYPVWGFRVKAFVDKNPQTSDWMGVPVLAGLEGLPDAIRVHNVQWVMMAPDKHGSDTLLDVFDYCRNTKVRFMVVADYYQMVSGLVRSVEIHGLPLVEVTPQQISIGTIVVKRAFDVAFSLIMLFILIVMLPVIALVIKLDSPGPVLYRQKRVGKGGREFTLYKFRSMVQDAEALSGAVWAVRNDPRVTRVGRLLRKVHLDEWPQFFNVLKGDMSLVGPRPERRQFVEDFKDRIPLYERRLRVRPGITGWAQVRFKYDETFEDVKEKTRYDLFYIDHLSLALDLKILLATVARVFSGAGHT